ncbi:hypothetical protein AB0M68_43565 [Streptomyces sp. NPDC051453]|uniref:hypothetical protein n=1 Tax=Streptomyces sp. NPDC051453 TaxID=3154941 RepID=UPI00341EB55E
MRPRRAPHEHSIDPVPSHQGVLNAIRDQDPARAEFAMHDLLSKARSTNVVSHQ